MVEYRYGADKPYLSKFSPETMKKILDLNSANSGHREWLADIYQEKDGSYTLGEPTYGNYDGITVSPEGQLERDIASCKLRGGGQTCETLPHRLVSTIHMHPIKMMAEENRRQNFSGTDIASEWKAAVDKDKEHVLFLTYPNLGMMSKKNQVKVIRFPNRQACIEAMKKSNPGVDPMTVNPQDQASRDSVDWIALQKEMEKSGHIETLCIEDAIRVHAAPSYQLLSYIAIGAAVIAGIYLYYQYKQGTVSVAKVKEALAKLTPNI